jgi:hypothetical protein
VRSETSSEPGTALAAAWKFFLEEKWTVLCLSALVIIPCLWHRHIEAGDLGSHVYNAWLAQLIGKGQAPGLYLARQWNNVLFDVALLHAANLVGFAAAEKVVVSASVLVFFWGVFALVSAVTQRAIWVLTPCIAMLAYGYSFNMGFCNYYLSIGLGCFCLALVWPRDRAAGREDWVAAAALAGLAWSAHPLGFLWAVAMVVYVFIRRVMLGWWKAAALVGAMAVLAALHWYLHRRTDLTVDWQRGLPLWQLNGADQLMVYGDRYTTLAWVAVAFGVICFLCEAVARRREIAWWKGLALPAELYLVAIFATKTLPENLRISLYAAWIGLLVSRLTTISAIFGFCVLGCAGLRKWALIGFAALAAAYFLFLYQDTQVLNRLEDSAGWLLSTLPAGTRIIPTIAADPDWRVEFIGHLADRACVVHCFVYSNYEPSSRQFRVRVGNGGSWIVTDSADDADNMQGGGYEIQPSDLPVKQLYQCDPKDWTKLCLRDLAAGQSTGEVGLRPGG